MDKYTKILFNELIFNNFEKIFNKYLISLIIYISIKTWNTWFDPVMCHPRNMEQQLGQVFSSSLWSMLRANWSGKISKSPPPFHT